MHNITAMRGVCPHTLSIAKAKYVCKTFLLSPNFVSQYRPRYIFGAAEHFSVKSECIPILMKYQSQIKSHIYCRNRTKGNISYATKVFSSCSLHHLDNLQANFPLELSITPVSPTLDDIQVKDGGLVNCQDENAVVTRFDLNLLNPYIQIGDRVNVDEDLNVFNSQKENYLRSSSPSSVPYDQILETSILKSELRIPPTSEKSNHSAKQPSNEQLAKIYDCLRKDLPEVFVRSLNYGIYHKDVIFENRISGTRTQGLIAYVRQAFLLRVVGHLKYAFVKFDILKITKHHEDGTIRVRWRISGLSAFKSFSFVWKMKTFDKEKAKETSRWHDGFSVFHVGSDGLIFKHIADKMLPDEEIGELRKASLLTRLASLIGLAPKTVNPQSAMTSVELSEEKRNLSLKENDIASFVNYDVQVMLNNNFQRC